jgi:uncharacterized protein HemY
MVISLLLAVVLLFLLWLGLSRGSAGQRRPRRAPPSTSGRAMSVRGHTQRSLVRLVGGNRDVAERLVRQVQLHHPDRPAQWCWEKAIYDLQRDRDRH